MLNALFAENHNFIVYTFSIFKSQIHHYRSFEYTKAIPRHIVSQHAITFNHCRNKARN